MVQILEDENVGGDEIRDSIFAKRQYQIICLMNN